MGKFFIPTNTAEDWKSLLAEPDEQWKEGYSAKLLAYCWQEANDFPESVQKVFRTCGIELFQQLKFLVAFPEYKVALPGGRTASQNDIFILAKGGEQLVSITVEGKKSEPFGETVAEWKSESSPGKVMRLSFLCSELELEPEQIDPIRYQLLHRTACAIIEAKKFNAQNALMLVHSFSPTNESFDDYSAFLELFGAQAEIDTITPAQNIDGIDLFFAWVQEK